MSTLLDRLPARWRAARVLQGGDARWDTAEAVERDGALLLAAPSDHGPSLLVLGDPVAAGRLLTSVVDGRAAHDGPLSRAGFVDRARWLSMVRGTVPTLATLAVLGLEPFSTWDWLAADRSPAPHPGEGAVTRLDPHRDAAAVRACLADANPGTSADPTAHGEAGWWGVPGPDGLRGVVGASLRGGGDVPVSWHLHGLGVRPEARGAGTGTALTTAVLRAGLREGAQFVSLGMYADNDRARRIYTRLGFRTEAELASYGPAGADRPAP